VQVVDEEDLEEVDDKVLEAEDHKYKQDHQTTS